MTYILTDEPRLHDQRPLTHPEHGWTCAGCGRGYAPWARECSSCPPSPAAAPDPDHGSLSIAVPPEMSEPGYVRIHQSNGASCQWAEVIPGLECRITSTSYVTAEFRLTPPAEAVRP